MTNLRTAIVVGVNQATRSLDLVYTDSNQPIANVKVAGEASSSISGSWNVPHMPKPANPQQTGVLPASGRSMVALVALVSGRPVVIGFLPASGNQMAFTDPDRKVERHASGVVHSIDQAGNVQIDHPGGYTLRIGDPNIEVPGATAADGNWSLPAAAAPTVTLKTPQVTITIAAGTGNVTVTSSGDVQVTAKDAAVNVTGTAAITAAGAASVTAGGQLTLKGAPVVLGNGGRKVVVDGDPVNGGHVVATYNATVTAG